MNSKSLRKTIVFLSLLLIAFASASLIVSNGETVIRIDYPQFYRTAALTPNQTLTIAVEGISGDENITLLLADPVNVYQLNFTTSPYEKGLFLDAKLPADIKPSLYDVILIVNGQEVRAERAVRVYQHWPEKIRIAHVTDSHIGLINSNGIPAIQYYAGELAIMQIFKADLIYGTGDLVDVGGNVGQYHDFIGMTNMAPLPSILMPGNHEYSGDASIDNWHRFMGDNYYYVRWGPYLFVALDSGSEGKMELYEISWLQHVLEENKDAKVKVLGFHHPIFGTKYVAKVQGSYQNIQPLLGHFYASWAAVPQISSKMLELIEKYNVTAVFNGHVHADGLVLYNGKTWFITTTAAGGPVRPGDYHGIRIVDIYQNGTVKIYPCYQCELWSDHASFNAERSIGGLIENNNAIAYYVNSKNYQEITHYLK
jgi:hypothetical protein